ncbi:MAG: hypothetical protein PHW40_05630 [Candidatus Izemoplasmatales bacterium]|nr:hypothetical protein [Candidatus Izemoplasmatales bacterium]MDD5293773.1 hypothetical protein [Candidatus Izemoplasmatales bacterium]
MKREKTERSTYIKPEVEVMEFTLEESIATSMNFGPSTLCGEETY